MRCGRNNPTHNSDLSRKTDECLEIYHLIDVLRCGNGSISRIINRHLEVQVSENTNVRPFLNTKYTKFGLRKFDSGV